MSRSSDSGLSAMTLCLHLATGSCFPGGWQASWSPTPTPPSFHLTSVLVTSWQPYWNPVGQDG